MTREDLAMYPEYEATTRRLARFFRVRPAELVLANGADDALRLIADTYVEKGSAVLLAEPTFTMYRFYPELPCATVVALRYRDSMRSPQEQALHSLRGR